jgi:hypothetical protein
LALTMILSSLYTLSLLAAGALASGSAPAVTVEATDGRQLSGALVAWRDGRLELAAPDGSHISLSADELLLLHAAPAAPAAPPTAAGPVIEPAFAPPPPADDLLLLAGPHGDRLVGHVVGGDAGGVRFQLAVGAPFEVDYERIARLLPAARLPVDRLMLLADGGSDDRLWRQRADGGLDSLGGVVDRIADGHVVFEGALGRMEFPLGDVAAVILAGGELPAGKPLPGLPVAVRLLGGSRVLAGLLELDQERVVLATRFAPRLELPAAALVSLVCRGAGRVLLADLAPVDVEQHPTLGGPQDVLFPWRADLSVTGRLLSVDGLPRATGLGVHATTRLAFDLPPGCRALRVTAGLCDEVRELPAAASVEFAVLVDGASRATARVTEDGTAAELRVDGLSGARRLELLVTDGGDDDAGDRAAWVDGVLLCGGD